jgi:hypothetical protein
MSKELTREAFTKKELDLIWDALTGRFIMFNRSGEIESARMYDRLRSKVDRLKKVM